MERIARTRSGELLTLTVFVVALGIAAFAAEVVPMSVALGAFFAGLVVGQSRIGPQAAADMARSATCFSALFFVSIGMLFDPEIVATQPGLLAAASALVLVLKPLAALVIVMLLRDSLRTGSRWRSAWHRSASSPSSRGPRPVAGILPADGYAVLVATAIVSIALNPLLFRMLPGSRSASRGARASARRRRPLPCSPIPRRRCRS